MKLKPQTPVEALRVSGLKFTPLAADVDNFARHLTQYRADINATEHEEHFKQPLRTLLTQFFDPKDHYINTQLNQDSAIYFGNTANSRIAVMFETKKPASGEMIRRERLNVKALHELVLYYFEEKIERGNFELKYLIATDYLEFFVFDANTFDKHFNRNGEIKKLYDTKVNDGKPNTDFYRSLQGLIDQFNDELPCVHFSLDKPDRLNKTDRTAIYKILSPQFLLKQRPAADSNALNKPFYDELLHIIGLTEKKDGKKIKIVRLDEGDRKPGSLLELTISKLRVEYPCNLTEIELAHYGIDQETRIFQIAFELCLTWINRILFLKLLESQLVRFHQDDKQYTFLNTQRSGTFSKLYNLFHEVLAVKFTERDQKFTETFKLIPYLNSSLFEVSDIERKTLKTNSLDDDVVLPYAPRTILRDRHKALDKLATLPYFFAFLDSYDYTSVTRDQLELSDKGLINSSILGKIFEKINGYKDGSIYTPGFITMYMCREALRPAVVNKFNELKGWDIKSFEGLQNKIASHNEPTDILEFNQVIDQLRICDPAVGSGHFLVSALNELIVIKHELGLLADENGRTFGSLKIAIEDDELKITDAENLPCHYAIVNGKPLADSQRLQKTLFHQKQIIIENCLFGVDINPNSVAICRLRLWIELLKHSYYKADSNFNELETLPNIDINIKRGNSLISRFDLKESFTSPATRQWLNDYAGTIIQYKNETDKNTKQRLLTNIDDFHDKFASQLPDETSDVKRRINKKLAILAENQNILFYERTTEQKERKVELIKNDLIKLNDELEKINRKYDDAFEWRFEFPEILGSDGNFAGFDVVIGNPPYIRQEELSGGTTKKYFRERYEVFSATGDLLIYFYELGMRLLRPDSALCLITSNKFMRASFGGPLRKFLAKYEVANVIDFGDAPVFEGVITYPAIVNIRNRNPETDHRPRVFTVPVTSVVSAFEQSFLEDGIDVPITALNEHIWRLEDPDILELIEKLKANGQPLGKLVNSKIYFGIKTGLNEAFVIDVETRNRLIVADPDCVNMIVPFLRGRDVKRWSSNFADLYLIKIESSINSKHSWSELNGKYAEAKFAETYPSIYEHLMSFRERLLAREDQGVFFWELRSCAYWEEFAGPKIIYPDIYEHQSFAWDEAGYLLGNSCYFIPQTSPWLLTLLNSKVVEFYYSHLSMKMRGGYFRALTDYIEQIPIPVVTNEMLVTLHDLSVRTSELKNAHKSVAELEQKIDDIVCDLFDLTQSERSLISHRTKTLVI